MPNQLQPSNKEPIAIIGIGCRFPGGANGPDAFWKMLCDGVDAISEVPTDRWNLRTFYDPDRTKPGTTYSRWGGFIDGIDQFDAHFFGISPREAAFIDPQQRILLELTWETLEDAGQVVGNLAGTNTGVFVGLINHDYAQIMLNEPELIGPHTSLGRSMSIAANRLSYLFDFRGPSLAVDTACSSSLVAVHLACQNIWEGICDLALAGGVNAILKPETTIEFSKAGMLSPTGRCHSFAAQADGFVRAEGAGLVALKALSRATADGDPIYAVIRSTAVNQDGRTNGIMVPSGPAQEAMLWTAYRQAGLEPAQIQYVEAHGTGTPVGDPIEANVLGKVLSHNRPPGDECLIGSVKSNIGHTESAAGIAGLIKVALALKHGQIPANLHFQTPNPAIALADLKLRVPQTLEPWPESGAGPRLAGVNSFGFGGTNAHAVLEGISQDEVSGKKRQNTKNSDFLAKNSNHLTYDAPTHILPLSARSPEALAALAQRFHNFLSHQKTGSAPALADICYSSSLHRDHHDYRLAIVAQSKEEMAEHLGAYLSGETRPGMSGGQKVPGHSPKVAFVFSGMGPQWWAMGRQLWATEPLFRATIEQCAALLRPYANWSLIAELRAAETESRIHDIEIAQPAIFAVQVALAAMWRAWGVEPQAIIGHSVGEVAAAHVAGALTLEDAIRVIFHRSRLLQQQTGQGKMLAVGLSPAQVETMLAGYEGRAFMAAINSPASVTLSGEADALQEIAKSLENQQVFCRFLRVEVPFHSPLIEAAKVELLASLEGITPQPPTTPLFSTVTGQFIAGSALDPAYWWQNYRAPVLFAPAIATMIQDEVDTFLELSPHPVLAVSIQECLAQAGASGLTLPSLRRQEPERTTMLGSLGKLYTQGYPLDWRRLYPEGGRFVRLPAYPWQRERHWHESEASRQARVGEIGRLRQVTLGQPTHPLLGSRLQSAQPIWDGVIDPEEVSYLQDHRIQGRVVYPAAAYIEMVLAAAREIYGTGPYRIEAINFEKVLFLADGVEPPTLQLTLESGSRRLNSTRPFQIYANPRADEPAWVRHVSGKIAQHEPVSKQIDLSALQQQYTTKLTKADSYGHFDNLGVRYGPAFQGIERLWLGDGAALGQITVFDGLQPEAETYHLHPALLDACFQVLMHTFPLERIYLPVKIDRFYFYERPKDQLWSHARLVEQSKTHIKGDIFLLDGAGKVLAEVRGLRCQALEKTTETPAALPDEYLYQVRWQLQPLNNKSSGAYDGPEIRPPRQIVDQLHPEVKRLRERLDRRRYYETIETAIDKLCTAYILEALQQLGWPPQPQQPLTLDSLANQLGVVRQHHRLLGRLLDILVEDGILTKVDHRWEVDTLPRGVASSELWQAFWQYPGSSAYQAELTLLRRCGQKLAGVLRGQIDGLDLIFPDGSLATAEHLYQDSPTYRFYNQVVQKVVFSALSDWPVGRPLRVLEIGGGTGGLTTHILPQLPAHWTTYLFSDLSQRFLTHAEQKFQDYDFVEYQRLDIETDPLIQGFEPHSFDLILASDALHATRDLRQTLGNVKKLLASSGLLVLLEGTKPPRWGILVFGLLQGWWAFADKAIRTSDPWVSRQTWQDLLADAGFNEIVGLTDREAGEESLHSVILARGPQIAQSNNGLEAWKNGGTEDWPVVSSQSPNLPISQSPQTPGCWLIFADNGGVGLRLAAQLKQVNQTPIFISPGPEYRQLKPNQFQIRPAQAEDIEQLLDHIAANRPQCRDILYLWSVETAPPEETTTNTLDEAQTLGCLTVLPLVQSLMKMAWGPAATKTPLPHLWLITRGTQAVADEAQPISVGQAPLWGLGRVINNEYPKLRCKLVDLSLTDPANELQSLFAEIWSDTPEEEIALRGAARYVPRLTRTTLDQLHHPSPANYQLPITNYHLHLATPGLLDTLTLRPAARPQPGSGEVEIEIQATGLNFKDIMVAMNLLPTEALAGGYTGQTLGLECAGRITAIGSEVTDFKVGDQVMALAPNSFSAYVTTDTRFVAPKPAHLTFEEAATIPTTFFTAYYCLHYLTHLRKGERILIHAAAGGVGLAAVQLAQRAGVEIFATAGSPEKRDFLHALGIEQVMDSRSLAFAGEIMEHTQGQGVDIVLNVLAGEAIPKSIAVLAPYGRFIEIGKQDIYNDSQLGLGPFRKNLSYFAVDIDRLWQERPALVETLFREIIGLFAAGELRPLPHRVLPLSQVVTAFRYMAQAKHIGKVVVSMPDLNLPIYDSSAWFKAQDEPVKETTLPIQNPKSKIVNRKSEGTYLITGGLGGFGLATARRLVAHGARHLVLMGRRGASSPAAQATIAALQAEGAEVVIAAADVTDEQQVVKVVTNIRQTMPPLRGVIHAAMIIDDGLLLQLDRQRFQTVVAPKLFGAWNLHRHTLDDPLDFFILFSSFTALIGTPGQGNYVAANAFLDALAHHRRARGLPALAIDWGAVADVGYVTQSPDLEWHLVERFGVKALPSSILLDIMGSLLQQQATQAAVGYLDWDRVRTMNLAGISTRFAWLMKPAKIVAEDDFSGSKGQANKSSPAEPDQSLEARLRKQVARVLEIPAARLDINRPLTSLGLDSLLAVELGNMITNELGVDVPAVMLVNGPSIVELVALINERKTG